ncbi:hypothetical protein GCM10027040_10970 [Halomonas shantousis]
MKCTVAVVLWIALSGQAIAEVYKCAAEGGHTIYAGEPCASDAASVELPGITVTATPPPTRLPEPVETGREASRNPQGAAGEVDLHVQQVQGENVDPFQCLAARERLDRLQQLRPVDWKSDATAGEYQRIIDRYCTSLEPR